MVFLDPVFGPLEKMFIKKKKSSPNFLLLITIKMALIWIYRLETHDCEFCSEQIFMEIFHYFFSLCNRSVIVEWQISYMDQHSADAPYPHRILDVNVYSTDSEWLNEETTCFQKQPVFEASWLQRTLTCFEWHYREATGKKENHCVFSSKLPELRIFSTNFLFRNHFQKGWPVRITINF